MIKAVFLNDVIISALSWWSRSSLSLCLHLGRILAYRLIVNYISLLTRAGQEKTS